MIKLLKPMMLCASMLALAACGGGSYGGSSRGASNPDAVAAGYQAYLQGGVVLPQGKQAAGAADVAVGADALASYLPPSEHPLSKAQYEQIYNCMAEKYPEFVSGATPYLNRSDLSLNNDFHNCALQNGLHLART